MSGSLEMTTLQKLRSEGKKAVGYRYYQVRQMGYGKGNARTTLFHFLLGLYTAAYKWTWSANASLAFVVCEQEGMDKIFWALVFRGRYIWGSFPVFPLSRGGVLFVFLCLYILVVIYIPGGKSG